MGQRHPVVVASARQPLGGPLSCLSHLCVPQHSDVVTDAGPTVTSAQLHHTMVLLSFGSAASYRGHARHMASLFCTCSSHLERTHFGGEQKDPAGSVWALQGAIDRTWSLFGVTAMRCLSLEQLQVTEGDESIRKGAVRSAGIAAGRRVSALRAVQVRGSCMMRCCHLDCIVRSREVRALRSDTVAREGGLDKGCSDDARQRATAHTLRR